MKKVFLLISVFVFLVAFIKFSYAEENTTTTAGSTYNNFNELRETTDYNQDLMKKMNIQEVFGGLSPIAISPFWGITLTSGASILAEKQVINNNSFLKTNKLLSSYFVFMSLLILSIATSIPNFFKVSKSFGSMVNYVEDKSGAVIYSIMLALSMSPSQSVAHEHIRVIYQAGFIDLSYTTLIMIAALVNYVVIQYVRYFCELMIFISPIPFIDAIFEIIKKSLVLVLFGIYILSPTLAFILNIIILLMSLLVFNKVNKLRKYLMYMHLEPKLYYFLKKKPELVSKKVIEKTKNIKSYQSEPRMIIPVFPLKKVGKIKIKDKAWLVADETGLNMYKFPIFRKPVVENLGKYGQLKIASGLTHAKIYNDHENAKEQFVLVINNHYKKHYDEIVKICSFVDEKEMGMKKFLNSAKDKVSNTKSSVLERIKYKLFSQSEALE